VRAELGDDSLHVIPQRVKTDTEPLGGRPVRGALGNECKICSSPAMSFAVMSLLSFWKLSSKRASGRER
jgi:hypothetical protein